MEILRLGGQRHRKHIPSTTDLATKMTQDLRFINLIRSEGMATALPFFDPLQPEHLLSLYVMVGEDEDLSSLEKHLLELPKSLQTRVLADTDSRQIDDAFASQNFEYLEGLIRTGLDWSHPSFENAPASFVAWMSLDEERQFTIRGEEVWDDLPMGTACAIDPEDFSRRLWQSEVSLEWIEKGVYFNDVLCRLNGSSWITCLAFLADEKEAFTLAAELAIFSSAAASIAENSNAFYHNIAEGEDAHDEAFNLIYAGNEDVDVQASLVQSAAVEILIRRGEDHPPINGAPFSGSTYDQEDIDYAREILFRKDESASEKVQKARLLSDLLSCDFPEKEELFEGYEKPAMYFLLEDADLSQAYGDDIVSLALIESLLRAQDHSLLITLLENCSLFRVDYIRTRLAFLLE